MKTLLLISIILFYGGQLLAQANKIFINSYLHQDTVLFVDTLVRAQERIQEDRLFFNQVKSRKVLTFENDSSALERVAFLAEDRSFFFVELLEEKVVTVHKLPPVQIDSFGSLMFPDDIMKVNLDQDGDEELLLWYTEAEEPPALFKLAIFEPISKGKNLELLIETPPLFPYPSYDPFTPPKSIVIKKNMITIPHCTGCESGREGTEEKAFLKYKNSTYSFRE